MIEALSASARCVEQGCGFELKMAGPTSRHIFRIMNRHMLTNHPKAIEAFRARFRKKRKRT